MSLAEVIEILGTKRLLGGRKRKLDYSLHDALTDEADWNAQYWNFSQDKLKEIKEKNEGITIKGAEKAEERSLRLRRLVEQARSDG